MEKKNHVLIGLFVGLLLFNSSVCAMEGRPAEWKRPEKPESIEEAQRMKDEGKIEQIQAKREEKEAAKEMEKAKTEEGKADAEEAIKEAKFRWQEGRYKFQTGKLAEAEFKIDQGVDIEKAQEDVEDAKIQLGNIETQIAIAQKGLAAGYESPIETIEVSEQVRSFNDYTLEEFSKIRQRGEPLDEFIEERFLDIEAMKDKDIPNYEDQKNALESLRDFLNARITQETLKTLSSEERNRYYKIRYEITERLEEIKDFKKEPPIPDNELATELKLDQLTPEDQIEALSRNFVDIVESPESLKQAIEAMKRYGLDKQEPTMYKYFNERYKDLAPEKESDIPETLKTAEDNNQLFSKVMENPEELTIQLTPEQEGGQGQLESIAEYVSWSEEVIKKGLNYVAKKAPEMTSDTLTTVGEKLTKGGTTALNYGQAMAQAPEIISITVQAGEILEKNIPKIKSTIEMVPGKKARSVAKTMTEVESIAKGIGKNKEALSRWGTIVDVAGRVTGSLGQLATKTGTFLKEFGERIKTEEPAKVLSDFEKASRAIEEERTALFTTEKKSKFAKIFNPIMDAAKEIGTWVKNLFKKAEPTLVQASKKYEQARNDYLTTIGLKPEDNPTKEQIKEKITKTLQNPTNKEAFKNATDNLAKQSADFADTYNKILEQVESVKTNYEWLVTGWDAVTMKKPNNVVDLVNNVVLLRDTRINFLESARNGVDIMKEDITSLSKGTDLEDLGTLLIDRLAKMASDQMVNTLKEYNTLFGQIEKSINQERQNLDTFIKEQRGEGGPPPG